MKQYTYHAEVMTMIEQFTAAFNDIIIKGYDQAGNLINNSDKKVRFVYAPKQKVYESLNTPGPGGITVPVVSVSLAGISRDKSRVFNKNQGFDIPYNTPKVPEQFIKNIPQPVPINLTINMSIMTRYQQDMDQIISNFVPYCDPYIIISWKFPGIKESSVPFEIRSEVLWSGEIRPTYATEIQGNQPFRLTADTTFTIKGWIFKRMEEIVEKIYYINADFSPVNQFSLLEKLDTETVSISAAPHIKSAYPYALSFWDGTGDFLEHNTFEVDIYGKYFFDIKNIYLSASKVGMLSGIALHNPFGLIPDLSANNPPFSAVKLNSFFTNSDSYIRFNIPQIPSSSGYIDIIAENEAGYGKLTVGSTRPYIKSWKNWTYEPRPYSKGLIVDVYDVYIPESISGPIVSHQLDKITDEYGNILIWV
jgi:hypothetical protein